MRKIMRKLTLQLLLIGLLAFSLVISPLDVHQAQAAAVVIDHFDDTMTLMQTGIGTVSGVAVNAAILGGERDVVVQVTAGGGTLIGDSNVSFPSQYSYSSGSGVGGIITLTYDGQDGDPLTLNPVGLGGVDIAQGGNNSALIFKVNSDDFQADLTVRVYSSATSCSTKTIQLPGGLSPSTSMPIAVVFAFAATGMNAPAGALGCTTAANYGSVGAIQILIDGRANPSTDITMDIIQAGALDYGDAPAFYGTRLINNGAAHVDDGSGLMLGSLLDTEADGTPNANANWDDTHGSADEDGVKAANTPWVEGPTGGAVSVKVSGGSGCLMGWIDWDGAGFDNVVGQKMVLDNVPVDPGTAVHTFEIPAGALAGGWPSVFYSRFRLYPRDEGGGCTRAKVFNGQIMGGEVEDYMLRFGPTAVTLTSFNAHTTPISSIPSSTRSLAALMLMVCLAGTGKLLFKRRST
jgi:hypothetical protein